MDIGFGMPRINLHKEERTLDANKQCQPSSLLNCPCSVTKNGKSINSTIVDGIVTIVNDDLEEGDTVDLWTFCFMSSEGGGICDIEVCQANEDKMQDYLDAQ